MAVSRKVSVGIAGGVGVALVLAAFYWFLAVPEPLYNGKALSDYLYAAYDPNLLTPFGPSYGFAGSLAPGPALPPKVFAAQSDAREALKGLGPKAAPLLTAWLKEADSSVKQRARKISAKYRLPSLRIFADRRSIAIHALSQMPVASVDVIEFLDDWLRTGGEQERDLAFALLATMVPLVSAPDRERIAARELAASLGFLEHDTNALTLWPALSLLQRSIEALGPRPMRELEPLAIRLLEVKHSVETRETLDAQLAPLVLISGFPPSTSRSGLAEQIQSIVTEMDDDGFLRNRIWLKFGRPSEKAGAALYFRHKPVSPELIVPLLLACLSSESSSLIEESAKALAAYGADAKPALPSLNLLALHRNRFVAAASSNAIERITRRGSLSSTEMPAEPSR